MLTRLTKEVGGAGEMLTLADKGSRPPQVLADINCELPRNCSDLKTSHCKL